MKNRDYIHSIFGALFFGSFIFAFTNGLGRGEISFWFSMIFIVFLLFLYFTEKIRSEQRQGEIERYRKNGVKPK